MKNKKYLTILIITILLILSLLSLIIVEQGTVVVLMRFGNPVKVIKKPGLHLKLPPPFHSSKIINSKLLMLLPRPSEFLTSDKKNLIIETAICYKIANPILFLKKVRDQKGLELRLTDLLSSHTGLIMGVKELSQIVNTDKEKIKFNEINAELKELIKTDAEVFGIEIFDVFIKNIMLPQENRIAVYSRMRAERERIAKKYLAEGEEKALIIKAEADKESRTIIAEAKKEADIIRGKADAEAMKIYGKAYRKNIQFYKYIRSLTAYENIFNNKSTIILDEKSPILKTLFSGGK